MAPPRAAVARFGQNDTGGPIGLFIFHNHDRADEVIALTCWPLVGLQLPDGRRRILGDDRGEHATVDIRFGPCQKSCCLMVMVPLVEIHSGMQVRHFHYFRLCV